MNIQLSINDWCDLFADQASVSSDVFWVRSLDMQQQIFLNDAFESTWGISKDYLYNNPLSFSESLVTDNRDSLGEYFIKRHQPHSKGLFHYRIKTPSGELKFIRDRWMTLTNQEGLPLVATGIAIDITQQMDCGVEEYKDSYNRHAQILKDRLGTLIQEEQAITIKLTTREKQCAKLLIQGKTARQTAENLFLSRRTVEKHLESLKKKFNVSTKLDLLKYIIESNYDLTL